MAIKDQEKKAKQVWLKALGIHIRKMRMKNGLTGAEMGRQLEMDTGNVSRLEKGRVNPSVYLLKQICEVCEISLEDFWKNFKNPA